MKIRYKEDPRAWRKNVLLTGLGIFLLSSVLRWRHILSTPAWTSVVLILVCVATAAWFRPRWFRGYYRFSTWAGFWSSQAVARVFLVLIFIGLIVPAGLLMRLLGKDPLLLSRPQNPASYWRPARQGGSLDRLF
jgi:hypothetical protein